MSSNDARIHDLGYRGYDGERAGLRWAMLSLGIHAVQRVLGLKRAFRHKLMPGFSILIAFVPAIAFVALAALTSDSLIQDDSLPTYGEYFAIISVAVYLFASFVAPEAICTDRRTGMLSLYLASPLNRTTYVVSKVAAVATALSLITLVPMMFMAIAYTIEGAGPSGIDGFAELMARILAAGILNAVFFATMTSAISSFTTRRGIASASIVMSLLIPQIVVAAVLESSDGASDKWGILALAELPLRSANYLLGEAPDEFADGDPIRGLNQISGAYALVAAIGFSALFTAIIWWRYQRLEVER